MYKNVYVNPKSGKFYTFDDPKVKGEKPEIVTVFTAETIYRAATKRIDAHGKEFRVLDCTEGKTKDGIKIYRCK